MASARKPQLNVRISRRLLDRAREIAAVEGIGLGQLVEIALTRLLADLAGDHRRRRVVAPTETPAVTPDDTTGSPSDDRTELRWVMTPPSSWQIRRS